MTTASWKALLVVGGTGTLSFACAEQQLPERQVPEQRPSPFRPTPCATQTVGYEDPTPMGMSAAQMVATFGARQTAQEIKPPELGAATPGRAQAEASVSFTYAGADVEVVRCPRASVQLVVPVRVALELSGAPEDVFDGHMIALGRHTVSVQGRSRLFSATTVVRIQRDAHDFEMDLLGQPDPPGRAWSSLCTAEPSSFLGEFFGTIPGPLLGPGAGAAMTCVKYSETVADIPIAGTTAAPPFLLSAIEPGCRELSRPHLATFRGEVMAADARTLMPRPASVIISIDKDAGSAKVVFETELPPSDWLRSFQVCPAATGGRMRYQLALERGPAGAMPKSEVFELLFSCEDMHVRCRSGSP